MKFIELTRVVTFKFIEAHLEHYEFVAPKNICQAFQVHRTQASKLIREYKQLTAHQVPSNGDVKTVSNLQMNDDGKTYMKSDSFARKFLANENPREYLDAVGLVFAASTATKPDGSESHLE